MSEIPTTTYPHNLPILMANNFVILNIKLNEWNHSDRPPQELVLLFIVNQDLYSSVIKWWLRSWRYDRKQKKAFEPQQTSCFPGDIAFSFILYSVISDSLKTWTEVRKKCKVDSDDWSNKSMDKFSYFTWTH